MIGLKVLTLGTFDLLHVGHLNLLRRCSQLSQCGSRYLDPSAGSVHIGVNSDRFVEEYKGRPPVCPENVRMTTVKAYGSPHLNDGPGDELIRILRPDLLVVGCDWHNNGYLPQINVAYDELFEKLGISLVYVPRTPGVSSSGLRR